MKTICRSQAIFSLNLFCFTNQCTVGARVQGPYKRLLLDSGLFLGGSGQQREGSSLQRKIQKIKKIGPKSAIQAPLTPSKPENSVSQFVFSLKITKKRGTASSPPGFLLPHPHPPPLNLDLAFVSSGSSLTESSGFFDWLGLRREYKVTQSHIVNSRRKIYIS